MMVDFKKKKKHLLYYKKKIFAKCAHKSRDIVGIFCFVLENLDGVVWVGKFSKIKKKSFVLWGNISNLSTSASRGRQWHAIGSECLLHESLWEES